MRLWTACAIILGLCGGTMPSEVAAGLASGFGRTAPCLRPLSHRGDSRVFPANTLEAFRAALDQGFPGVELDVHFSKDGEAIVSHDNTLTVATNCPGYISATSADQIARCTAYRTALLPESGFIAKRAKVPAKVPRLRAALDILLSDTRSQSIVIDIKPKMGPEGMIQAFRNAMPRCLEAACVAHQRRITFISQNRYDAGRLHQAFPHSHVALESSETVSGLIDQVDGDYWPDRNIDTFSVSYNSLFDPKLLAWKLVNFQNMTPKKRFRDFYAKNQRWPPSRRLLGWTINGRAGVRGLHDYAFDDVLTDLTYAEFVHLWHVTAPQAPSLSPRPGRPLCPRALRL